jgi:hypothetical protein
MPIRIPSVEIIWHFCALRGFLTYRRRRISPYFFPLKLIDSTMKVLALFVSSLAAVSAFAPTPAGRTSTQINESLFDKVCRNLRGESARDSGATALLRS